MVMKKLGRIGFRGENQEVTLNMLSWSNRYREASNKTSDFHSQSVQLVMGCMSLTSQPAAGIKLKWN